MDQGIKKFVGIESRIIRTLKEDLPIEIVYGDRDAKSFDVVEIKNGFALLNAVEGDDTKKVDLRLLENELRYRNKELYDYLDKTSKTKKN